ncbi:MAG TPA: CHRD domain-containing protein [Blastocatellia bacterium]|nr:CHRD domain-containing protein [Blastocatellia bacterium]
MMKRSIASVLFFIMAAMSAAPLFMPAAQAQTETIVFTAILSASNEVAPVVVHPTETGTTGSAFVTLEVTRSGGVITAATTRFDASLSGMAANSVIILAHVHEGAAGVNGPIRIDSNISPAAPVPTVGGAASFTRTGLATTPSVAQAIINNPAGWYFNVHTALSPGGVARGQLVRQQAGGGGGALGAPTLSEWGAILMTLLFIALGTFFIIARGPRTAMAAGATEATQTGQPVKAIDWGLLAKIAVVIEIAVAAALVALKADAVDVFGALVSGLIVAFILHLFVNNWRR